MKYRLLQLFILFNLFAFAQSLTAQPITILEGQIFSSNHNEPIAGALIFTENNKANYADEKGYFKLEVPSGKLHLTIEFLGFESYEYKTNNLAPGKFDLGRIELQEKATFLKEVQVSASQLPFRSSFEGTNYYVSPKLLKDMQPVSTEEALKMIPGVNILGDMGLSNRPNVSIRGSWGRRSEKVLMMEDGSPISPAPYTAPGIYYNPISDRIDAIEVYTGADILKYGPNNMFGIINYITPKPPQQPGLRAKIVGGQRGFFTGLLSYGGTWNKVGTLVEAVYKRFDGFIQNSSVDMINLNAKIFAELSENQSLYFKVSGQFEDNQATLSSITPLTFKLDPTQNPFDADRFTMHRYGLDIIHKWLAGPDMSLTTKIFASDFARDWWRQTTALIPAADVRGYVGENIFSDRYSYLEGQSFGENDFVRVGRIRNGRESTTDSRWHFTIAGVEETFQKEWKGSDTWSNSLEAQLKVHSETYKDMILSADSSRWARSGTFTTDLAYSLRSVSGYIRNQFQWKQFHLTPILRFEQVWMDRVDRLAGSTDPNSGGEESASRVNNYNILQPGLTLAYQVNQIKVFGSVYRGYIAPSKYFAFLVERDGVLVPPDFGNTSNIKPEISLNSEIGIRGELMDGRLSGQFALFNNRIRNFYLAGWNEYFDKLGVINIRGLEASLRLDLLPKLSEHKLSLQPNITLLQTNVISGEMIDRHLFTQVVHNAATRNEFIEKVNANPAGYQVYVRDGQGTEQLLNRLITEADLSQISRTIYKFGEGSIEDGVAPYSPAVAFFINVSYSFRKFTFGLSYNRIGEQYAEFANFSYESSDGAIGKIPAYQTFDFNINYDFILAKTRCSVFIAGKNIGNDIYMASRLNRGQSGIMPGGFRQVNAGINMVF